MLGSSASLVEDLPLIVKIKFNDLSFDDVALVMAVFIMSPLMSTGFPLPEPWDYPSTDYWKIEKFNPSWNEGRRIFLSSPSTEDAGSILSFNTYNPGRLRTADVVDLDQSESIEPFLSQYRGPNGASFAADQGKTYKFRISNVGLQNSIKFRIQNHKMTLVGVERTPTFQTTCSLLDVGQPYYVLKTADQPG